MNDQEIRTLEMFKRVRVFDGRYTDNFAAGGLARELFEAVVQVIDELEENATTKTVADGTKRQNTAGKAVAREALRERLEAIRRTARSMAFTTPGMEDKFRIPRGAGDQTLINTGRAFVQEGLALKAEFIRYEMPADFIDGLSAAINNLENAIRGQSASKGTKKLAMTAIDEAIGRGTDAVRRLDPIVRNKFADQPTVLSEWEGARHIQRGPRTQRDDGGNNNDAGNNQPPAA